MPLAARSRLQSHGQRPRQPTPERPTLRRQPGHPRRFQVPEQSTTGHAVTIPARGLRCRPRARPFHRHPNRPCRQPANRFRHPRASGAPVARLRVQQVDRRPEPPELAVRVVQEPAEVPAQVVHLRAPPAVVVPAQALESHPAVRLVEDRVDPLGVGPVVADRVEVQVDRVARSVARAGVVATETNCSQLTFPPIRRRRLRFPRVSSSSSERPLHRNSAPS